jgi:hypothetical protein
MTPSNEIEEAEGRLGGWQAGWSVHACPCGFSQCHIIKDGDEKIAEAVIGTDRANLVAAAPKLRAEIERLTDIICLADELLMEAKGAFPLPGNTLRDAYLIVRSVSGKDYHERKRRAALATPSPESVA